jgi:phage baseplate assembly protein W
VNPPASIHPAFPFRFDGRGRTALAGEAEHVRDMIEQLLFTHPGERVRRPDFGSGLLQLVFAPNGPELAATVQFTVQAALQRWLGDVIDVRELEVTALESRLTVVVEYSIRRTQEVRSDTFERTL